MTYPQRFNAKSLVQGLLFGALVVLLMIATVGCDKDRDNNNNNNRFVNGGNWNGGYYPGDPRFNSGNGYGILGIGYDFQSDSEVLMEIITDGAGFGSDYFAPTGISYIRGEIDMRGGMSCLFSGAFVPPDYYTLDTIAPGQSQNGYTQGVQLVGYGRDVQLQIVVNWALIQTPYGTNNYSDFQPLTATLQVVSVNGVPCNQQMSVQP